MGLPEEIEFTTGNSAGVPRVQQFYTVAPADGAVHGI